MSTPDPDPSASEQNEAPEINIASNDDITASLDMLYPNPGGIVFFYDIWMVYIPGLDQDIDLLQDLTLVGYLASDKLSIEVSVY